MIEDAKRILEKKESNDMGDNGVDLSDKIDGAVVQILNSSILETQVNGKEVLYFSGKFVGTEIMRNCTSSIMEIDATLDLIKGLLKKSMMGTVERILMNDNEIVIDIKESAFCGQRKGSVENRGKSKCHFLAGLISGIISYSVGHSCVGKETACRSKGDPFCTFRMTIRN